MPHVLVDGAPGERSVLTLSHWPGTPTPPALRRDLSTASCLAALASRWPVPARTAGVAVDHLDLDGLLGLLVLAEPGRVETQGGFLEEVARVGDFGVVRDPAAARVAWGVAASLGLDPLVGFGRWLVPGAGSQEHSPGCPSLTAALEACRAGLGGSGEVLGAAEEELASWSATDEALAAGRLALEEEPERDLVVVRLARPDGSPEGALGNRLPLHPAALHSRSARTRVCLLGPGWLVCWFRYESWVRLGRGRPPGMLPRVDLGPLAAELSDWPGAGGPWTFDGPAALVPFLRPRGTVEDPEAVLERLRRELDRRAREPAAWDPLAMG